MQKRSYKNRVMWSECAESALVELWQNKYEELRSARKNSHIYSDMANELLKDGLNYSTTDIKTKISNFTTKYKKEKSKTGVTGGSPSDWSLYDRVHQILGNNKCINTQGLVVESIIEYDDSGEHDQEMLDLENTVLESQLSPTLPRVPSVLNSSVPSSTCSSPGPGPSCSTSRPERNKKNKNYFQTQLLKHMESTDESIKVLVKEVQECTKIDKDNSENFKMCATHLSTMCEEFTAFMRRQK